MSKKPPATFIFEGTVETPPQSRASATRGNATSVRVERVDEGAGLLADLAGQVVLVRGAPRLARGVTRLFRTVPVSFGNTVEVQAVDVAPANTASAARSSISPELTTLAYQVGERAKDADVILSGRVTDVKEVAGEQGPVSEHSAVWRDATVRVERVHKGREPGRTVTVRFPESTDVRWHDAPKFTPGQQGVFLLHVVESEARGAPQAQVFTALHPRDFVPSPLADAVMRLVHHGSARRSS